MVEKITERISELALKTKQEDVLADYYFHLMLQSLPIFHASNRLVVKKQHEFLERVSAFSYDHTLWPRRLRAPLDLIEDLSFNSRRQCQDSVEHEIPSVPHSPVFIHSALLGARGLAHKSAVETRPGPSNYSFLPTEQNTCFINVTLSNPLLVELVISGWTISFEAVSVLGPSKFSLEQPQLSLEPLAKKSLKIPFSCIFELPTDIVIESATFYLLNNYFWTYSIK